MIDTRSKRGRASAGSRALGVAISLAANAAFLAVLALSTRVLSGYSPARAVEVQLVSPTPPKAKPGRPQMTPPRAQKSLPSVHEPPVSPATGSPPITPLAATAAPTPPPGLVSALRGRLACDHADLADLTQAERQRCRDRFAGPRGREQLAAFGVDPSKRAIFDAGVKRDHFLQEPFLAEKPKKGCRPMVTLQEVPATGPAPHDWTMGVACGVQF